jgi:perosamine synthetase
VRDRLPVAQPWFGPEEARAAVQVLASGWVAQGPRVAEFERAVATAVGSIDAVATSSCTAALHLALIVAGIGPGDDVIVPSLSFVATANVVGFVGANVVFADVDESTLNLTPETISASLTPSTRAVIVAHQAGAPADMTAIHERCDPAGIIVIEDAACAIGSTLWGRPVGSHSDLVAFSFHPRKVITTGEGGMLATSRPDWAGRLRRLRSHGMSMSDAARHASSTPVLEEYLEQGLNYRMTDLQASVGLVQLDRLEAIVERRRRLAARYQEELAPIRGLVTATDPPHGSNNYQSFWALLPDAFPTSRDELLGEFYRAGIGARRGIMASHLEPAYSGHRQGPLPVTERVTHQSVILPLFHDLTAEEQDHVVAVFKRAARGSTGRSRSLAARDARSGRGPR